MHAFNEPRQETEIHTPFIADADDDIDYTEHYTYKVTDDE